MNWTYEQHKHYSTEHMHKAEKQRNAQSLIEELRNEIPRIWGKRARRNR